MKKILPIFLSMCLIASVLHAQQDCNNGRYMNPIFENVDVNERIQYGSALQVVDVAGVPPLPVVVSQNLFMDIYEPAGDVAEDRPVIILAFGGAFVFGSRTDAYMVDLCTRFAQLGYVVASIDYRLTRELILAALPLDPGVAPRAVAKGMHDMRASVRFFRRSVAEEGNPYRINPDQIYVGGLSAGALCATHVAYLDRDNEIPDEIRGFADRNGGLAGNSGNPGYSSKVSGVISFSGALGEKSWMNAGDAPIVSTHGTNDDVVPFGRDSVSILGINYPVDGSSTIHERAELIGNKNAFYVYQGASHAPEAGSEAYRDTGFFFARDFMFELVCNETATGISQTSGSLLSVYPNPATNQINIQGTKSGQDVSLINAMGKVVYRGKTEEQNTTIQDFNLPSGLYLLKVGGTDANQVIRVQVN